MFIHKILSLLLEYPDAQTRAILPELAALISDDASLDTAERAVLERFLNRMADQAWEDLEAAYVATFDLSPAHSLHLTHHIFGDDRGRGPALIDLTEYYKNFGFEAVSTELPDYLPLVLEFAAQLDSTEARLFLNPFVKILSQLSENLEQSGSAYAPLMRLAEAQAQLVRQAA